jgi:hypothetical protein
LALRFFSIKALGIKTHSIHFSSSAGDIIYTIEGNTEQMAQVGAITIASGAFQSIASEELMCTAAMNLAMTKAGKPVGKYKAPKA